MALLKIKKSDGSWGLVGGEPLELDTSLTQSKYAADAKAVGDSIAEVKNSVISYTETQDLTEEQKTQALTNLGVYAQDNEPTDAEVGTLWIDTDEEGGEGGNGASIALDTTLTQEGMAADAKAVGDGLRNKPGLSVSNKVIDNYYDIEEEEIISYTGGEYAEVFNAYDVTDLADIPVILNRASGNYSHAEGYGTRAIGDRSHTEGSEAYASGRASHAEGFRTTAEGIYSHAEGIITIASGDSSHAEGDNTIAEGLTSHAEGFVTIASGDWSHAEGCDTIAEGDYSHAEGFVTIASGDWSHAEGCNTTAEGDYSHVQGKYNLKDVNNLYAHIVGNGNGGSGAQSFSNAHTLDWEGNAWYSGDVYVGSTSGTNKDEGSKKLATEEYVDKKIGNIQALLAAL